MALRLITAQEFRASRYGDVADQIDGTIETVIEQAEANIEETLDRRLKAETYTEILRPKGKLLRVEQYPINSVTSIKRRSTHHDAWTTLDLNHFEIEPKRAAGTIVSIEDEVAGYEVEIVYNAGYTTIPSSIKAAVILQTVLLAFQDLEVFNVSDGKEPALGRLDRQYMQMLKPFKKATILG